MVAAAPTRNLHVSRHRMWCLHDVSLFFCITGYIGIVKDATEDTARVELHSSCKTISVDKSRLSNLTYVSVSVCCSVCCLVGLWVHFSICFLSLSVSVSVCFCLCLFLSLTFSTSTQQFFSLHLDIAFFKFHHPISFNSMLFLFSVLLTVK